MQQMLRNMQASQKFMQKLTYAQKVIQFTNTKANAKTNE